MQCPFCKQQMILEHVTGDGRTKLRWEDKNSKTSLSDKLFTSKGRLKADYSFANFSFHIDGYYCPSCNMIILKDAIEQL